MAPLFDLDSPDLHLGYRNLRAAASPCEQTIKAALEEMWARFEPHADANFTAEFARDPDGRFWEMYLGCALLDAGKPLQLRVNRPEGQGNPDLCIVCGERRIWVEAIAPDVGDAGADQVPGLVTLEDGGGAQAQPMRQIHLRITGGCGRKDGRSSSTALTASSAKKMSVWSPYQGTRPGKAALQG